MKKFCIITVLAVLGTMAFTSGASAQCKVEDIFNKYKVDTRCNSVNMSKEMLTVIANQRNSPHLKENIQNISSVKILTVKVPKNKKNGSFGISTNGDGSVYFDGEAFSASLNESLNQSLGEIDVNSTPVSEEQKEEIEKNVKEKLATKEAQLKKKQEEKQTELKKRQEAKQAEFQKKFDELSTLKEQIAKEANDCIEGSKYTELMSINDNGKHVTYFAKQEAEKIKEFIVVTNSSKEYSIIIIKGDDIKIQSVSRLSEIIPNANFDMDYLE
jgi:hypothetical protein